MIGWLRRNYFWWYQGPMLLWAVVLFVQSSIPASELPEWEFLTHDKLMHVLVYVVFSWAVHRGISNQDRFPVLARHSYVCTIFVVALYGVSDEFHQSFVPGRESSVLDWMANCAGAMVFVAGHWIWKKVKLSATTSL